VALTAQERATQVGTRAMISVLNYDDDMRNVWCAVGHMQQGRTTALNIHDASFRAVLRGSLAEFLLISSAAQFANITVSRLYTLQQLLSKI